ncbi:IclR family transcriptional regulator [Parafrigoribacterium soli]|uniref:IclR family transcriptional regulator n=1 Tax=Parafrigoribacterium soli TaxID=3144663 RepID=UPI0032ED4738
MSSVPAAREALRIIKYLASHSGPVRAATICRDLDLPRSTTYHLLKVLQEEGFLLHSPENQAYVLGPLISDMGSSVLSSQALARLAQPMLERLVAETRMPVVAHLGVLNHSDVVYASKVSAHRAPAVVTAIGVRLPSHLTATGRSMLSALPEAQLRALYPAASALVLRAGPGPTTLGQLDAILAESRERGWAVEDGEITIEYASVAAAVLDHNRYPAASIGLTFRGAAVDAQQLRRLGAATVNAAAALSQRIRGRI